MTKKKNVFLFPGYGTHQRKMLSLLSQVNDFFRERLDEMSAIVDSNYHISLLDEDNEDEVINILRVFSAEVAVSEFWEELGLISDIVIGHSMGEYAAAVTAGIFNYADGVYLLTQRYKYFREDVPHCTAFSETPDREILEIADEYGLNIDIISYNTPISVTVCGERSEIDMLIEICRKRRIRFGLLNRTHGAHYPALKKYADQFLNSADSVEYNRPDKCFISTLYPGDAEKTPDCASYWAEQIYKPVKFMQAVKMLPADEVGIVLDTGISPVLLGMAEKNLNNTKSGILFVPTIKAGRNYCQQIKNAVETISAQGIKLKVER